MTSPLLHAENLRIEFTLPARQSQSQVLRVLQGLSLNLQAGEIGCLLGPSGCGKTTLLRAIAGFQKVQAGEIRLRGNVIASAHHHTPPEHRQIGLVFQEYALFPHLTIADNVAFGLQRLLKPARQARVDAMLSLVGLSAHAHKFPHELSGGQQQRVALARALAPQPTLLLLDEPFSNLDVALRERLSLEVRNILKEANATAILVTHDQQEAFAVADQVGVMHEGRILQWDTPYHLYHQPNSRFVADFVGQGVFVPGRIPAPSEAAGHTTAQVDIEIGALVMAEASAAQSADVSTIPEAASTSAARSKAQEVDVLLRPDDITHDDASPLQAEVVKKVFRGADFVYTLKLSSGQLILANVPSHHNHAIGEKIGIKLDADHVVTFPRISLPTPSATGLSH
ncbi:ABC transporter ATP-binding protein [Parvibium lacunae]|uniref:ABC transporter ATP-binding protein n=1 Tax=Parvibium lacunae TaxID=1888893 RepID=A0A368L895_9BURK|nr:ABC transporter ATP-binding protein [Parvibium lacunae]RCS59772.1 ABC transporter ATP-binding protein [Parvibium lacunae]